MNFHIFSLLNIITSVHLWLTCESATPDFSLVGFATLYGNTTGGAGGKTVTPTSVQELIKYGASEESLIIQIKGKFSGAPDGVQVRLAPNKTLIGIGSDAFLEGVGVEISNSYNVIVRNIKFTMISVNLTHINSKNNSQIMVNDGDTLRVVNAHNVWVDHCEFYNVNPLLNSNYDYYDGLLDMTHNSTLITVSWNYFHDHWKCMLVGSSDNDKIDRKITFHHNHFFNVAERLPSYRFGNAHIFNNYYEGVLHHAINSRMNACIIIERNYFENSTTPVHSWNSLTAGYWQLIDNYFAPTVLNVTTIESNCTFSIPYNYTTDNVQSVKDVVKQYAGVGVIKINE